MRLATSRLFASLLATAMIALVALPATAASPTKTKAAKATTSEAVPVAEPREMVFGEEALETEPIVPTAAINGIRRRGPVSLLSVRDHFVDKILASARFMSL